MSEGYKKRLARKYNDKRFRTKNIRVLAEAVDKTKTEYNYIYEAYDLTKKQRVCLKLMSEVYNVPPNQLILQEDIYKKMASFWRKLTGNMPQDAATDVSADKSPLHNKLIAQAAKEQLDGSNFIKRAKRGFKAGERTDGRGGVGTKFRSAIADMASNFQFGVHAGADNETVDNIRGDFAGLVDDFETVGQGAAKEIVKLIHKAAEESNFPNNPSAEEFSKTLFGHSHPDALESKKEIGGILGAIISFRNDLQASVDEGLLPTEVANSLLDMARDVLRKYAGQVKDVYASRMLKTTEAVFGREDILYNGRYSLANTLLEYSPIDETNPGENVTAKEMAAAAKKQLTGTGAQAVNKADAAVQKSAKVSDTIALPASIKVTGKDKDGKEVTLDYKPVQELAGKKAEMQKTFKQLFKQAMAKFGDGKHPATKFTDAQIEKALKTAPEYKALINRLKKSEEGYDKETYKKLVENIKKQKSILFPLVIALIGAVSVAFGVSVGGDFLGRYAKDANIIKYVRSLHTTNWISVPTMVLGSKALMTVSKGNCLTGIMYKLSPGLSNTSTVADFTTAISNTLLGGKAITAANLNAAMPGLGFGPHAIKQMLASGSMTVGKFFAISNIFGGTALPKSFVLQAGTKVFGPAIGTSLKAVPGFYAAGATKAALASAGFGTTVATAGTALIGIGAAMAILRKMGTDKNRRQLLVKLVDSVEDIKGASKPLDPVQQELSPVKPDVVNPVKDPNLKASFDLVIRFLKRKGYKRKDALKLMQALYNPETKLGKKSFKDFYDETESQQTLQAHYARTGKYSLSVVLSEDISYKKYTKRMARAAKKAKVPVLSDEQLRVAAIAINNAYIIGDIDETTFPKDIMEKVIEVESEELKKKYEDALKENEELDRIMKNAVESAAAEIGVQAETIGQLKGKLDAAVKKGDLSESELQMAIRTIQGLEQQVEALQKNVDENVAYLYGEMYVMHEILKKIMNNPELNVDDNEEKKMSDMYEKLIARLDLEGSADYTKFLENGTSIAQLNSIFARIDEEPTDFLEDVMDLTSYLNELHAKYMAAKSSGKKYDGAAADLAKLYYALSGKSTTYVNPEGDEETLHGVKAPGSIARSLQHATEHEPYDVYNKIRKQGLKPNAEKRYEYLGQFKDEMRNAMDAVDLAMDKGGAVTDPLKQFKKRVYNNEKKKRAEANESFRHKNDDRLLIERWHKLAGLK